MAARIPNGTMGQDILLQAFQSLLQSLPGDHAELRIPEELPSIPQPRHPMRITDFLKDDIALLWQYIWHPGQIPGYDLVSKLYALSVLPIMITIMPFFDFVVQTVENTWLRKLFGHNTRHVELEAINDALDPWARERAIELLRQHNERTTPWFSYYVAHVLLVISSEAYEIHGSNQPSHLRTLFSSQAQRDRLERGVEDTERLAESFGMRFYSMGELKFVGGPVAGIFYDKHTIVLVYKGTTVSSFDECLVDATFQRRNTDYLHGEVHKGFHDTLFESTELPPPPNPPSPPRIPSPPRYGIHGPDNPIKFIMEAIFIVAEYGKRYTGQPVNLWITGHSLGGALAALTMARLQTIVTKDDPLMQDVPDRVGVGSTVLEVMLSQFSQSRNNPDSDLVVLRDCYTIGSPIVGDSSFARTFGINQENYIQRGRPGNRYKPVYWRIVNGNDIVPRVPPNRSARPNAFSPAGNFSRPHHLHSWLDYQHVGQLVEVYDITKVPTVQPSVFQHDWSECVLHQRRGLSSFKEGFDRYIQILEHLPHPSPAQRKLIRDAPRIRADIVKSLESYDATPSCIDWLKGIPGRIFFLHAHSPLTYQNNLILARFFFKSYPWDCNLPEYRAREQH